MRGSQSRVEAVVVALAFVVVVVVPVVVVVGGFRRRGRPRDLVGHREHRASAEAPAEVSPAVA